MVENSSRHPALYVDYLNRFDVDALARGDAELLATIENCLAAQGRGETVIEPRDHLEPGVTHGHFNVHADQLAVTLMRPGSR
jgi:alanine dehydrogenase